MLQDSFHFHVPIEIIKAGENQAEMVLGGIASTGDFDRQGESLIPEGLDYSYLKENGYINWHHQLATNPEAVIGEPTKCENQKGGFYIEAKLYKDSDLAKKAYNLCKVLNNNSTKRKMGWSIEGKVLERDPLNKNRVLKAKVTGVALTPMPINPSTFVNVIKAMTDSITTGDGDQYNETTVEKAEANGGSETYILNEKFGEGEGAGWARVSKTGLIEINLAKALSVGDNGGGGIAKEDLEKKVKNLASGLTKAEAYEMIFRTHPDVTPTQAVKIYQRAKATK